MVAQAQADHRAGPEAEERPAPHPPLLGRLEQEGRTAAAQLEVRRDGRLGVGHEGVAQRHQRVLAGQRSHLVEARREVQLGAVSDDGH
jgi:hypothetical protein